MGTVNFNVGLSGGGGNIQNNTAVACAGQHAQAVALPVGVAGTLSTRTSGTAGVITVAGLGGIAATAVCDIYWAGGMCANAVVTATTSTTITFDDATGTALPAASTAVVICQQVVLDVVIPGPNLQVIGLQIQSPSANATDPYYVNFESAVPATVAAVNLTSNIPWYRNIAAGDSNPFSSAIVVGGSASNGSAVNAASLMIIYGTN